jgi:glycosyltransferase involved in cell wall biosynthesis
MKLFAKSTKQPHASQKSRLIIYNLAMDESNPSLRFTQDWVNEFSTHFNEVIVYATHVGVHKTNSNVKVIKLGGGSVSHRIMALVRLVTSLPKVVRHRSRTIVFHHMSTFTTVFPGVFLRILGIKQGLWYSHSKVDKFLRIGALNMNAIFSPHRDAFPLKDSQLPLHFSGHGVSNKFVQATQKNMSLRLKIQILSVGRIARIKKLERLIEICGLLESKIKDRIVINLVGPFDDYEYLKELQELANKYLLPVCFIGALKTEEVIEYYKESHFYYMGTPNSVDKAALEASFLGCIPISSNNALQELTGVKSLFWESPQILSSPSQQLNYFIRLNESELKEISDTVCNTSRVYNNLSSLISYIVRIMSIRQF